MPFLALTRAGVASFLSELQPTDSLWIGSDVLTEIEVSRLRSEAVPITVFAYPIRTKSDIDSATPTILEHHPAEKIRIQEPEHNPNPRSTDILQAFLWREFIVGVKFNHNNYVQVVAGPHAGAKGSIVTLLNIEPEPEYIVEAEAGHDIHVFQSQLAVAEA